MILNTRFNIGKDNNPLGEIHENLYNILLIFHSNPEIYLKSVSINISYLKLGPKKDKRQYLFILKTPMRGTEDIKSIIFFVEQACKVRSIELNKLDRMFVRLLIESNKDSLTPIICCAQHISRAFSD